MLDRYEIAAVGFDNQGETFVIWDGESGRPLTPAIVWQDKRGVEVCEAIAGRLDQDALRRKTGLLLDSYFSAPKFRYAWEHIRPSNRPSSRAAPASAPPKPG